MKLSNWWLVGAALTLTSGLAGAQPAANNAILHDTFETGLGNWAAFGEGSKVSFTEEAANVKEGKGALRFDYAIKQGQFTALLNPIDNGLSKTIQSFQFWVKSDYATNLTLVLQERNGGRYLAMFAVPAKTWQRVEIEPSDFALSVDPNDPKDPDNKLDLDQVEAMALGDLNQIFIQNAQMAQLMNIQPGPHTLYVDDFLVSPQALPAPAPVAAGTVNLDLFARPQLSWISVGGMNLSRVEDKVLDGPSLQDDYQQTAKHFAALIKGNTLGKLTGKTHLTFDVASLKSATLLVQLEEKGGGKYNTAVEVPANAQLKSVTLNFSDLKPAQDSKDANNRLDLDQVKQIFIADLTGLLNPGQPENANTLWLGKLRAS